MGKENGLLDDIISTQSILPVTYTLEAMTKKTPGALHPFTRSADGGVLIHGKISRTAYAQVAHGITDPTSSSSGVGVGNDDGRYRTLLRNRLLDTTVNSKRFVQPGGMLASTAITSNINTTNRITAEKIVSSYFLATS